MNKDHLTEAECRRASPRPWRDGHKKRPIIKRAARKVNQYGPALLVVTFLVLMAVAIIWLVVDISEQIPDYTSPGWNTSTVYGIRDRSGAVLLRDGLEYVPVQRACVRSGT